MALISFCSVFITVEDFSPEPSASNTNWIKSAFHRSATSHPTHVFPMHFFLRDFGFEDQNVQLMAVKLASCSNAGTGGSSILFWSGRLLQVPICYSGRKYGPKLKTWKRFIWWNCSIVSFWNSKLVNEHISGVAENLYYPTARAQTAS